MSRRSPRVSAAEIGHSEDLIREILLRVPAKFIIQMRLVSIQWMIIISSPQFRVEHSRRNQNRKPSGLVFYDFSSDYKRSLFIDLDDNHPKTQICVKWRDIHAEESVVRSKFRMPSRYVNNENDIQILNSCNGLFLCEGQVGELYLCNATTKESLRLPLPNLGENGYTWSFCLSYDPKQSPDYNVYCLWSQGEPKTLYLHVYSSRIQFWRLSLAEPLVVNAQSNYYGGYAVFWNSKMFWMLMGAQGLLCYDIGSESLGMKQVPPTNANCHYYFGASCGRLILVNVIDFENYPQLSIYEMQSGHMNWLLKYNISFRDFAHASPIIHQKLAYMTTHDICEKSGVLGFLQGSGENHDMILVLWINGFVVTYNIQNKKLQILYRLPTSLNKCMVSYWVIDQVIDTLTII